MKIKIATILVSCLLSLVSLALHANAQGLDIPNPIAMTEVKQLVDAIATWLFNIGVPIAVMAIVYSGIRFLISKGNPAEVTTAKRILIYAIIGLAVLFIGRGFMDLVQSVLNLGN